MKNKDDFMKAKQSIIQENVEDSDEENDISKASCLPAL